MTIKRRRLLSMMMALVMCLSLLPAPVRAANGPSGSQYCHVWMVDSSTRTSGTILYDNSHSNAMDGASYDLASNTLSLTGFNGADKYLVCNEMGEDFALALTGDSTLGGIIAYGCGHGGSLHIKGSGSLTVTGAANMDNFGNVGYGGILLEAENSASALTVDNTATVTVYGYNGGPAVTVTGSTVDPAIVVNGVCSGTVGHPTVKKAVIPWKDSTGTLSAFVYHDTNETKLYEQYEYYGLDNVNKLTGVKRAGDQRTLDCVTFHLWLLESDGAGGYLCVQNYGEVYVWSDDPLYEQYASNLDALTLDVVKPGFVLMNTDSVSPNWSILDGNGDSLSVVEIVPGGGLEYARPTVTTTALPAAKVGAAYSARLEAAAGNEGGAITSFNPVGGFETLRAIGLEIDQTGEGGRAAGTVYGTPTTAGTYTFSVVANELTTGGTVVQSFMKTVSLTVTQAANTLTFGAAANDGFVHTLTVTNTGTGETVKTRTLAEIAANQTLDLGNLAAGSYTAALTGTTNGASIDYGSAAFTVTAGEDCSVTLTPTAVITLDGDALAVRVSNYDAVSAYPSLWVTVDDSTKKEYLSSADKILTGLSDGTHTVKLYARDSLENEVLLVTGNSNAGDSLTLTADTTLLTAYTVSLQSGVESVYVNGSTWVNRGGSLWIIGSTAGLTAQCADATEDAKAAYDLKSPAVTVTGTVITVAFPALDKTASLSGSVRDGADAALAGVSVAVSQTVNDVTTSIATVTDEDGKYTVSGLAAGKPVYVSVSMAGYAEQTKDAVDPSTPVDFTLTKQKGIAVYLDGPVSYARITLNGSQVYNTGSGEKFFLPVNTDGTYTVSMTSSSTVGTASGTAVVKNGVGSVTLTPERKGFLEWSGVGGNSYVHIYNGDTRVGYVYPGYGVSMELPAGSYTVYFTTEPSDGTKASIETASLLTLTAAVTAGETVSLEGALAGNTSVSSGTLTGPVTAMGGEVYKLSGVIESTDGEIRELFINHDNSAVVQAIVINGKRAQIDGQQHVYRTSNSHIDWSLPLSYTVYCVQKATANDLIQTVTAMIMTDRTNDYQYVGAVSTRYVPNLTLTTANRVGGVSSSGVIVPGNVAFHGNAPANAQVKLYDNDVLCAVTTANLYGTYEGVAALQSGAAFHLLRAETTSGSDTLTAEASCAYDPVGPVLTRLRLNGNEMGIDGRNTAYAAEPNRPVKLEARIENEARLDTFTYHINGTDVSGQVFFRVSTLGGVTTVKATKSGEWWTASHNFGVEYPTEIKVLYRAKPVDYSNTVTVTDETGTPQSVDVDLALRGETTVADAAAVQTAFDRWINDIVSQYQETPASARSERRSNTDRDAYAMYDGFVLQYALLHNDDGEDETIDLFDAITSAINKGGNDSDGEFIPITPEQSAASAPENMAVYRTYTDRPTWTTSQQNVKLRTEELKNKGYTGSSYTDTGSGHSMLVFTGTFYYDAFAKPVENPTRTVYYSGIAKSEDDPRMFRNGRPLGSTLEVIYVYDEHDKLWLRHQSATMAPGAKSPIHTTATQIPCATDAPFSYKPANVNLFSTAATVLQDGTISYTLVHAAAPGDAYARASLKNYKSGMDFHIDVTKVSRQTYVNYGISVAGAASSKFVKSETYWRNTEDILTIDKHSGKLLNSAGIELVDHMGLSDNVVRLGVTKETVLTTATVTAAQKNYANLDPQKTKEPTTTKEACDNIYYDIRDNIRYYAKLRDNTKVDYQNSMANIMIEKSNKMSELTVKMQDAFERAEQMGEFTKKVSDPLTYLSIGASLAPGVGTVSSLTIDSISFLISAANDTKQKELLELVEEYLEELNEYLELDEEYKKIIAKDEEREKKSAGGSTSGGSTEPENTNPGVANADASGTPVHDPSGIVYEGVIENPVAGATVTLYRWDEASNTRVIHDDSHYLGQNNPLTSDETGYYRWDVPVGDWFVTASKDGYESGNSNDDVAATVTHSGEKYLPVLPPQLDVNIPLMSYAEPVIESVRYTTEGIYVTFSKYMTEGNGADSVLNASNYTVENSAYSISADTTIASVTTVEQGHTPANRGDEKTYSRTVLLVPNDASLLTAGSELVLTVSGTVKSYAGVPMGGSAARGGTVQTKETLGAPVFSVSAGEVDKNTVVMITLPAGAPDGTVIYYTTDGSTPSATNGKKAVSGVQVTLSIDTALKAVAFKAGYQSSPVTSAAYTIRALAVSPVVPVPTPNYGDYSIDTGSPTPTTVPVTGDGTVQLRVTVNGSTAALGELSDDDVAALVGAGGDNLNVAIDLGSLGSRVETVSIPKASVDKLADALEEHDGNDSLTVKTANGFMKLNEKAVSAAANAGTNSGVELTIKSSKPDALNAAQRSALSDKTISDVYTLGITAGGKDVGTLGGGFAEIIVPFTPTTGTNALDYRTYRVAKDGTTAVVPSAIHDGKLTVRSDRLSDIVVVYEPINNTFTDVPSGAYYADAVLWALSSGITNGMGDDLFAPDNDCTRAQVVTFLWRAAGSPQPKSKTSAFSDVVSGTWYSDAVAWAVENGITYGVGDGRFGINEFCTRAQVVTFLYRMNGGNTAGRNPFTDVKQGEYYYDAVLWAYASGITGGTGDGKYSPDAHCTRSQIVTFLYRDFVR